jgi:Bax protein
LKSINLLYPIAFVFVLFSCSETKQVNLDSNELFNKLDSIDYSNSVPKFYLQKFPDDLDILLVDQKKTVFIKGLLPLIILENNKILNLRSKVQILKSKGFKFVKGEDKLFLRNLFEVYRVEMGDFDELSIKLNTILPSLVIAQAAIESAWGTSRFCIEGNALFGQHTFSSDDDLYMQAAESDVKMRKFNSLYESVHNYFLNINRHRAYSKFRTQRINEVNSLILVENLRSYSERGEDYINDLKSIIRINDLTKYDSYKLE